MPKHYLLLIAACLFYITAFSNTYNILDFGAKQNTLSTTAIQEAIDECHAKGGGQVLVPAGTFITGTLVLKSYVNLHLISGATLEASLDLKDYQNMVRQHGMIVAVDATQVSITGLGTIQARGIDFYDPTQNHTYPEYDRSKTRQGEDYQREGVFTTDGPIKRKPKPGMGIEFYNCTGAKLLDFTLKDTPSWSVRIAYCEDVVIDGISILNNLLIPNSDGVHCTTSRNVRISNYNFVGGDDALVVTGFNIEQDDPGFATEEQSSRTYGNKTIYSENITVSNCHLQSRSSGIRVGYGQHPIRNCTFDNIQIYESNRGIGIFAHDSVDIENLFFSNITIQTRLHNGQWWGNAEPIHLSAISRFEKLPAGNIKNVYFNNIVATSEHGILLYGTKEGHLENIHLDNVRLHIKNGKETLTYGGNFDLRPASPIEKQIFKHDIPGIYAQQVNGLNIEDFRLTWDETLPDFFTHGIQCEQVTDLSLNRIHTDVAPNCKDCRAIQLNETSVVD
jgi:hypothetical protein